METLMKELNKLLENNNTAIDILRWEKEKLEKENAELRKEIVSLCIDIEKYKENEVNRI